MKKHRISESPEELAEAVAKAVQVEVKWSDGVGNYLPFTALPSRYDGKVVRLVIVDAPVHGCMPGVRRSDVARG